MEPPSPYFAERLPYANGTEAKAGEAALAADRTDAGRRRRHRPHPGNSRQPRSHKSAGLRPARSPRPATYLKTRARAQLSRGTLVAPVEVAAAAPETLFGVRACMLRGVLAGPGENGRLGRDSGLLAVHRLLQPGLLLGLEERMVVEGVVALVLRERHRLLELRVPLSQLEVILNDLREQRRCLNRHGASWRGNRWGRRTAADSSPSTGVFHKKWGLTGRALRACEGLGRDGDTVLPRPLGLVESRVRRGEQRRSRLRLGMGRDAEARGHRDGLTVDRKDDPHGEGSPDAVRDIRGSLDITPG